jgi:hypothetical protein
MRREGRIGEVGIRWGRIGDRGYLSLFEQRNIYIFIIPPAVTSLNEEEV